MRQIPERPFTSSSHVVPFHLGDTFIHTLTPRWRNALLALFVVYTRLSSGHEMCRRHCAAPCSAVVTDTREANRRRFSVGGKQDGHAPKMQRTQFTPQAKCAHCCWLQIEMMSRVTGKRDHQINGSQVTTGAIKTSLLIRKCPHLGSSGTILAHPASELR